MRKLTLGTAQFGSPYGIANVLGQTDKAEVESILHLAASKGICSLDTAIAYGDSEQILGEIGIDAWAVSTKLPAVPEGVGNVSIWINQQLSGSLQRLGITQVDGFLLHRPSQLLASIGQEIYNSMCEAKRSGRVRRIGISVYDLSELDQLIPHFHFDIVQAPLNIFDARLPRSGWMQRLREQGIALHARSVFLQGLLLMDPDRRPAPFTEWCTLWNIWDAWLSANGITPLQACLRYALSLSDIEQVVLGVDNAAQLRQILLAAEGPLPDGYRAFQTDDVRLLNPALWVEN